MWYLNSSIANLLLRMDEIYRIYQFIMISSDRGDLFPASTASMGLMSLRYGWFWKEIIHGQKIHC